MQDLSCKKVLLYSGGLDSWLIDKIWKPDVKLYINIQGEYNDAEIARLPKDVIVLDFPLLGKFEMKNKFVPLRNLYFLMIASNYGTDICLGATAGDGSKDKNVDFLYFTESMLSYLWNDKKIKKTIHIEKTFSRLYKNEILDLYISKGGNINQLKDETFSCYTPINGKECFDCYPCFRKFSLLFANGAEYTKEERKKMWEYVRKNVIPTKEEGGYDGTYYTDRGVESVFLVKAVEQLRKEFCDD